MALDPQDLKQFVASVARLVRDRLIPAEARVAAEDRIPEEVVADMRKLGLFGMTLPQKYGGLELNACEEVQVVFELCYAAPAFRGYIGANNSLGGRAILWGGTDRQRDHYLPRIASGELLTAFALTEPSSGSDATALNTRAHRRADGCWVINGGKRFITGASEADVINVVARTEPGSTGGSGVSVLLVERGTPGLVQAPPDRKMGQQGAHTGDLHFEDCVVPPDALLGEEGKGFKLTMRTIDRGRLHIGAASVGLAGRLIDEMLRYALERRQFGQPIAQFQLVQAMLADSRAEHLAARALVLQTAARCDRGEDFSMDAACCKMYASEMVGRVADRAIQVFGGAGYMQDSAVERLYRDARIFRIYEGTTQIQQITIAKHLVRAASALH
ncbi:acyl-CoA dehydrogenase family protein [Variovorax sp. PBL-E5]|uniref:acyl-CoA dehydrogenase family protein n=1 Tax=Variovorax sp. PBL-E5 TaxID=434014 RepID=UPI001317B3C2|nr:acyl-CoA dehydrogenase family protein [Variovorax sp. PBL-E5]VTU37499.1 Acyl-CoA dehydrogenase [Variovorax sp. PBL-E5]